MAFGVAPYLMPRHHDMPPSYAKTFDKRMSDRCSVSYTTVYMVWASYSYQSLTEQVDSHHEVDGKRAAQKNVLSRIRCLNHYYF